MFCHKCGAETTANADFCHKCGMKIISPDTTRQPTAGFTPNPVMTPYMQVNQANTDSRQQSVIGLCKAMFVLRLIDAIGWSLVIILQLIAGIGFWEVIWNIVATIIGYNFTVQLFGITSNGYESARVLRVVRDNMGLAIMSVVFYGLQLFAEGLTIIFLFVGLEIAILLLGALVRFTARQAE